MKLAILVIVCLVYSLLNCLYVRREKVVYQDKGICVKEMCPKGWKEILVYIVTPISLLSVSIVLMFLYQCDLIFILKKITLVALLWPISITDIKQFRVPNKLILCGIATRLFFVVLELTTNLDMVLATLILEGIAVAAVIVLSLLCCLISKGGLGMGDIKLLIVIALFLGVEGFCYSLFVSIVFAAIVAIFSLVAKKKTKKDMIPFAPFTLLGTITSLILTGV